MDGDGRVVPALCVQAARADVTASGNVPSCMARLPILTACSSFSSQRRGILAGVKGEVWIADYTDEEGRHQVEMVLSKDDSDTAKILTAMTLGIRESPGLRSAFA